MLFHRLTFLSKTFISLKKEFTNITAFMTLDLLKAKPSLKDAVFMPSLLGYKGR
jgi:hypothetical protein